MRLQVVSFILLLCSVGKPEDLPACAGTCVAKATLPASCSTTDFACICKDKTYISSLACCSLKSCAAGDIPGVQTFANSICGNAGVPIDIAGQACSETGTTTNSTSTNTSGTSQPTAKQSGASSATPTAKSGSSKGAMCQSISIGLVLGGILLKYTLF
ncbi:hypothetical protein B0J14DRAFT_597307 [Halenospora varia]|nr:hypothetical protein B0J14DRAFT_597307 [Halenospora varia]